MHPRHASLLILSGLLFLAGCQSAYYGAMEKFGVYKRDILVDRVTEAREAQEEAKDQFASTLEKFLAITKVETGDLKRKYDTLDADFKRSEARAAEVHTRVDAIDDVAKELFSEWKQELGQYTNANLRRQSERQLQDTQRRYDGLIAAMRRAEDRMEPVLSTFRDQVLFLKHNLNAQALAGLDATAKDLEQDIARLIADMEKSIREADAFIKDLKIQT